MLPVRAVVGRTLGFRDPFHNFWGGQDQIDRIFALLWGKEDQDGITATGWLPAVDLYEEGDAVVVKAELPGITKDDLSVTLQEDTLTISGTRKSEKEDKEEHYLVREGTYGQFHRVLRIPHEVKADKVRATFNNGILEVTLPKAEAAKVRDIKIDVK